MERILHFFILHRKSDAIVYLNRKNCALMEAARAVTNAERTARDILHGLYASRFL